MKFYRLLVADALGRTSVGWVKAETAPVEGERISLYGTIHLMIYVLGPFDKVMDDVLPLWLDV